MSETLHIVFTDFPGPDNECVFVEVETPEGKSVNVGEWRRRSDGLAELVIARATPSDALAALMDAANRLRGAGMLAENDEILQAIAAATSQQRTGQ